MMLWNLRRFIYPRKIILPWNVALQEHDFPRLKKICMYPSLLCHKCILLYISMIIQYNTFSYWLLAVTCLWVKTSYFPLMLYITPFWKSLIKLWFVERQRPRIIFMTSCYFLWIVLNLHYFVIIKNLWHDGFEDMKIYSSLEKQIPPGHCPRGIWFFGGE